jgi:hypothetical protein
MLKAIPIFIFVLIQLGSHLSLAKPSGWWYDVKMVTHTSNYTNTSLTFSSQNCRIFQGSNYLYRPVETMSNLIDFGNDLRQYRYEAEVKEIKELKYVEQDRIEWKFIRFVAKDPKDNILNSFHIYGSKQIRLGDNPSTNQPLCASENAKNYVFKKTRAVYSLADDLNQAFDDRRCVWIIEKLNKGYVFWNHAFNTPLYADGSDLAINYEYKVDKPKDIPDKQFIFNIDCDHHYAKCNPNRDFVAPLKLQ